MNKVNIELPSCESLLLECRFNGALLSTGTGFVVKRYEKHFLLTARHVVTGRHQETGQPLSRTAGIPNEIIIYHNGSEKDENGVDTICKISEKILDKEEKMLWVEHPELKNGADIIALPITIPEEVRVFPVSIEELVNPVTCRPTQMVSIVGFPFGETGPGNFAIWSTGFIASEIEIPWKGKPVFLIDSRTRSGQSGSPVFAYRIGIHQRVDGSLECSRADSAVYNFLGLYTGRINEESDLGIVWNAKSIREIVDFAYECTSSA